MKEILKFCCYIEEYKNEHNKICARLRDKISNKKISMTGSHVNKNHLLLFLSQAKLNQRIMSTVYDREGADIVAVRGVMISEDNDHIVINIDVESGGYLFE